MRNAILATLSAAILVALPTASFAGWQFGVQAGAALPAGDFLETKHAATGYIFGALADYQFGSWVVGANFSMTGNNHEDVGVPQPLGDGTYTLDEKKYSTTQFGGHVKYMLPIGGGIKPYGILGVGSTKFKENETTTFTTPGAPDDTRTQELEQAWALGGKLGAGTLWWLSEAWGFSGEVDYDHVLTDEMVAYFSFRAGAMFRIPGAK